MKKIFIGILFISFIQSSYSQQVYSSQINTTGHIQIDNKLFEIPKFDTRRIYGLTYSTFVPGSGQYYLGHKTKGAVFAVSFISSLVGALVSHNNFIGNRERIQALQFEYLNADRFTLSEYLWKQMVSVHDEQKLHERSRNIFLGLTISIWTFNMIDYIFFTKDKGPVEFSYNYNLQDGFSLFSISVPINLTDKR